MAKKTSKLENLISAQVTNALETAKSAKTQETAPAPEAKEPKKKTISSKSETPAETKKKKTTKEVAKQQKVAILEEVVSQREVKYIYPEDVTDTLSRKKWRQQTRNELHRLEREMHRISDQNSKEYKKAKKAYDDYRKQVLKPNQVA